MKLRRYGAVLAAASLMLAACGSDEPAADEPAPDATDAPDAPDATDAPDAPDATDAPDAPDAPDDTSAGPDTSVSGDMIVQPGECGLNTGTPADDSMSPIVLGGAATNIPGVDFTAIPKMAKIYFDCVNANGGIYGHPIQYSFEDGAPDPAVWQSIATKLVEQDKVMGIVGNTSILECDVNGQYYADNGYHPIIAGVAPGCFLSDQWSAVNMGPYYSNLGAAQAAVRAGATGKLVVASPDQPGMDFNNTSVEDLANIEGMEFEGILEVVPVADPAAFAQRLVDAAGEGGGVVLNFTSETALPLLQAIAQQGLVDSVIWASSTPPNDPSVAAELGECCPEWNDKFLINAEFNILGSGLPDQSKMEELLAAANPDFSQGAFSQMGYLVGKFTTEALLRMGDGAEYNVETVNAALYGLTNAESDLLCKPWYYSSGPDLANVSNNTDRTVVPRDGKMVQFEDCFEVAATDNNPLQAIRDAEG